MSPARRKALVPTLVSVAAVVSVVSSLGAPLIPSIARADGVSLSTGQWVLTATLLSGALVTPVAGRLADGRGQREIILLALIAVLAGCVISACSGRSFPTMVVGRLLQGTGLGLLPVTMSIACRELPASAATKAVAALSITTTIGAGLGFPLTGLVAEVLDVSDAYWFGTVTTACALVLAAAVLPRRRQAVSGRFDFVGASLLGLAVTGLSVLLSEGNGWGWGSVRSLTVLGASVFLLLVWIPYELRVGAPLVDLRLVRNRSVLTAYVAILLVSTAMYLFIPLVIEFLQAPPSEGYGFAASIVASGLVMLPMSLGTVVASRTLTAYERRFGTRSMIPLGSAIFLMATLFFAFENQRAWEAYFAVGFAGLGVGMTFAAMPNFIIKAVPVDQAGSATGFYQVLRAIGLSIGTALGASLLATYTPSGHTFPAKEGFQVALLVSSALCLFTAVTCYLLSGSAAGRNEGSAGKQLSDLAIN